MRIKKITTKIKVKLNKNVLATTVCPNLSLLNFSLKTKTSRNPFVSPNNKPNSNPLMMCGNKLIFSGSTSSTAKILSGDKKHKYHP